VAYCSVNAFGKLRARQVSSLCCPENFPSQQLYGSSAAIRARVVHLQLGVDLLNSGRQCSDLLFLFRQICAENSLAVEL